MTVRVLRTQCLATAFAVVCCAALADGCASDSYAAATYGTVALELANA